MSSAQYPVKIGTHNYVIDLASYSRAPLQSIRQQLDVGMEPGEQTLDNQGIWKRTQTDYQLGAGQRLFDQEDEANRRRFRESVGIDPFTERGKFCLLPATTPTSGGFGGVGGVMLATASALYAGSSTTLNYTTDGSSWSTATGLSGNVQSLASWGGTVYCGTSVGLYQATDGGGAFSAVSTGVQPVAMVAAMGRLLLADNSYAGTGGTGPHLLELVDPNGTPSFNEIYQYPETGFTWTGMESAPNGIYAWGENGRRSDFFLCTVVDATGEMNAPFPAGQMLDGETVNDAEFYGGFMWMATSLGFRMASINGSGFLTIGPLIDDYGALSGITAYGRFIYASVQENWSDPDGTAWHGTVVFNPEYFTDPLQPAFATYLMDQNSGGTVDVAVFDGQVHWLRQLTSTVRPYTIDGSVKAATGKLWSGGITFGTPELKAWMGGDARWESLPAGATVTVALLDGIGGSATTIVSGTATSSTTGSGSLATPPEKEIQELKITLTHATDTTAAVCFDRWTVRTQPLPFRSESISFAVIIYAGVRDELGNAVPLDPKAEFDYLHGLFAGRSLVDFQFGHNGVTEKVIVDMMGVHRDEARSELTSWDDIPSYWPNGRWAVRLITVEV